jgi:hypothetical protein
MATETHKHLSNQKKNGSYLSSEKTKGDLYGFKFELKKKNQR